MRVRTLIVDDEPLARRLMCKLFEGETDFEIIGECADGCQAVDAIKRLSPELVLLDIQMPEMGGFEVLEQFEPARLPVVIFVTAYDQHALKAFAAHAIDYLLKPFDDERFREALQRAQTFLNGQGAVEIQARLARLMSEISGAGKPLSRLAVKGDGRTVFVKTTEIDWIEAVGNYLNLHVGKETFMLRGRLSELEKKLSAEQFFRIHRSTIVNLDRVKEFQPLFKGEGMVLLRDGTKLNASRTQSQRLQDLLEPKL